MSWTLPRTWLTGEVLSKANLDAQVRDNLSYLKTNIALEAASALTIVAEAVTKTRSHHTITPSGDLKTISGGAEGEVILIRPATGQTIALKHNHDGGNIWSMSGYDVTLDSDNDYSILVYSASKWTIMGGSGAGTVNTSGVPEANDIARFTDLDTIEGISYAELLLLLGVFEIERLAAEPALELSKMYHNTTSHKLFYCKEDA